MKRIILDIDDKYGSVLSLTAIGVSKETNIANTCINIQNINHIILSQNEDGKMNWETLKD